MDQKTTKTPKSRYAAAAGLLVLAFWLAQPIIGVMCVAPTILYGIYCRSE